MSYTEWTRTSTAYQAYREAADRCEKLFHGPTAELGEWVHPRTGQRRRYVNNIEELIGLEVWRYNTGNVSGARLDGEVIANRQAVMILSLIGQMKLWVDDQDKLHWYKVNTPSRYLDAGDIVDAVKAAL